MVLVCLVLGPDAEEAVDAAVAKPVAGAFESENVGVVDDPVDHRGGDGLVAEHGAPAGERPPVSKKGALRDLGCDHKRLGESPPRSEACACALPAKLHDDGLKL